MAADRRSHARSFRLTAAGRPARVQPAGAETPTGQTGVTGMAEHQAAEHKHGEMDIAEHQRMFDAFIRFWIYLFGGAIGVLIFLALVNS